MHTLLEQILRYDLTDDWEFYDAGTIVENRTVSTLRGMLTDVDPASHLDDLMRQLQLLHNSRPVVQAQRDFSGCVVYCARNVAGHAFETMNAPMFHRIAQEQEHRRGPLCQAVDLAVALGLVTRDGVDTDLWRNLAESLWPVCVSTWLSPSGCANDLGRASLATAFMALSVHPSPTWVLDTFEIV